MKQYKFLRLKGNKIVSENGNTVWKLGKWNSVKGKLEMCHKGFHSCEEPYRAFCYIKGEILAVVESKGEHLKDEGKYCWRHQRAIKFYRWTKEDSVRLAIYSASLVLKYFEKEYPNDKRPRKAIEAAKKCLSNPTKKNLSAAYVASTAAYVASTAAYVASTAAYVASTSASIIAYAAFTAAYATSTSAYNVAANAVAAADTAVDVAYISGVSNSAYSAADAGYLLIKKNRSRSRSNICIYFKKLVKKLKPYEV